MTGVNVNRRGMLAGGAVAGLTLATAAAAEVPAVTPIPTLDEALRLRRSTRAFQPTAIDAELQLALAWAALGVNRPETGLRTAPSWRGAADTRLHLADDSGVRLYDPAAHGFVPVLAEDVRTSLSPQPFVATAPLCLIYTSDVGAMPTDIPKEEKAQYAAIDAAIVAQNVYLFCASRGLGTCLVGGLDAAAVHAALGLGPDEVATFVQPVGWPA